jgi:type IV pilus assembly protein PilB
MEEQRKIQGEIVLPTQKLEEAKETKNLENFKEKIEKMLSASATELLQTVFAGAITLDASDIHFEPEEKEVRLRVRMDGILHDVLSFPPTVYDKVVSRIKLLGGLKINISDRPQDGRFYIVIVDI